jgi:hypothetical protein
LPGDDVIRRARIHEVAQAVFPASQLGAALVGYIRRPFSAEFSSVRRVSQLGWLGGYIRQPFSTEFSERGERISSGSLVRVQSVIGSEG